MWTLERPAALLLIPFMILLASLAHGWKGRGGLIPFSHQPWPRREFEVRRQAAGLAAFATRLLFWGGFLSILVALGGPATITRQRVDLTRGIDIVIALDVSPSMSVIDWGEQSRFDAARDVIRQFIAARSNDSLGLVAFGTAATLAVPVTQDYAALRDGLDRLQLLALGDGTAIGRGIAVGTAHLVNSTAPRRILILITDGENNAGEIGPAAAAGLASAAGVRIYTIGVAREGQAILEFADLDTGVTTRGSYRGRPDEALLRSVAEATGGYYSAADDSAALQATFEEIDSLERTERRIRVEVATEERSAGFALIGVAAVLADFLIRRFGLKDLFQ